MEWMNSVVQGDSLSVLSAMPDKSVHCVVTSPPYWGLRQYGDIVWAGGDPLCKHAYGRPARGGYDEGKQITNRGSSGTERAAVCARCGAKAVASSTSVNWPSVTYTPMAGLPEVTVPAWEGELGQEPTPLMFVAHLVLIFREVWRVLRDDATCFLNIADSYYNYRPGSGGLNAQTISGHSRDEPEKTARRAEKQDGLKEKDLVGIPWRVAYALQADGWYLRNDIIWRKTNGMPASMKDRCTVNHEYIFLFTKSDKNQFWTHRDGKATNKQPKPDYRWVNKETGEVLADIPDEWKALKRTNGKPLWKRRNWWDAHDYYFDAEAIKTPVKEVSQRRLERGRSDTHKNVNGAPGQVNQSLNKPRANVRSGGGDFSKPYAAAQPNHGGESERKLYAKANARTVWTISTGGGTSFRHYAVFPEKLPERCIKAGAPEKCCAECNAPYVRIVKTSGSNWDARVEAGAPSRYGMNNNKGQGDITNYGQVSTETVAWAKTCQCDTDETVGGIVLDPFAGAATTLLVARKLGRRWVGIEIAPAYKEMGDERMRLPFEPHHIEPKAPEPLPDVQAADGLVMKPLWERV